MTPNASNWKEVGKMGRFSNKAFDQWVKETMKQFSPPEDILEIARRNKEYQEIIFDSVFQPLKTKLLQDAEKIGCKTVAGYKMLLYQGVFQFELFTGEKAPIELMKQILIEQLSD